MYTQFLGISRLRISRKWKNVIAVFFGTVPVAVIVLPLTLAFVSQHTFLLSAVIVAIVYTVASVILALLDPIDKENRLFKIARVVRIVGMLLFPELGFLLSLVGSQGVFLWIFVSGMMLSWPLSWVLIWSSIIRARRKEATHS